MRIKPITINSTGTSSPLAYFPVLFSSTDTDFRTTANGGSVGKNDGTDIFFTDANGNRLNHELESYSPSSGNVIAWVQVPSLPSSGATLYVYFGNSTSGNQQNSAATWDTNYKQVLHLNSGNPSPDSTANGFSPSLQSNDTYSLGKIASGMKNNNGAGAAVTVGSGTALDFTSSATPTWSFWLNPSSLSHDTRLLEEPRYGGWGVEYTSAGLLRLVTYGSSSVSYSGAITVDNNWHYYTVTYDGTTARFYKDGTLQVSSAYQAGWTSSTASYYVGGDSQYPLWGSTDEVRISNIARSADWIKTEYANQNAPASFYGLGPSQSGPAGAPDLTIASTHSGNFLQGQTGATYTITATNSGTASTSGTVTVADTVPAGLTATGIAGNGWTCTQQPSGPCTRSDVLAAGASYPAIALTVTVAVNAPSSVTNTATVSGGGETNTSNDTANDLTTIIAIGSSADPRRIGVRSTGSYWGAAGEQIDLLSGNLNFSLPLIQAKSRGGWGATFALSYNSQTWLQNSGVTSNLGRDIGYGMGWTFQAGALVQETNYYLFRDSTGAEYRLDQYANGVWTSIQGIYLTFDPIASKLYFPDGSFWIMNVQSASGEQDAGTLYPSQMEDSNGNYIQIQYCQGLGASGGSTSGRIMTITDTRVSQGFATYMFNYTGSQNVASCPAPGTLPTDIYVSNSIYSTEAYHLHSITEALQSPFTPSSPFGSANLLQSVTITGLGIADQFTYASNNATNELTQVITPLGGTLGWSYGSFTNSAGLTVREVQGRTSSAPANSWIFISDGQTPHASTTVADLGAEGGSGSSKFWTFRTDPGSFQGLASTYEERDGSGTLLHKDYTWLPDSNGNVYMSSVATTLSPGTANAAKTMTQQTLDVYGNLVASQVYDYYSPASYPTTPPSPATRTYNYAYVTDPNYTSLYIRNRLASASVTPAVGAPQTLVTNYYDVTNTTAPGYCGPIKAHSGLFLHDTTAYPNGTKTMSRRPLPSVET